jgi:hypothetical protein
VLTQLCDVNRRPTIGWVNGLFLRERTKTSRNVKISFSCGWVQLVHNNNLNLHYPQSHLSVYQKGAHYTGIKVFNRLPVQIKQLSHDTKQFKMALKGFLYLHPFYLLDEYFKYNTN